MSIAPAGRGIPRSRKVTSKLKDVNSCPTALLNFDLPHDHSSSSRITCQNYGGWILNRKKIKICSQTVMQPARKWKLWRQSIPCYNMLILTLKKFEYTHNSLPTVSSFHTLRIATKSYRAKTLAFNFRACLCI